MSTENLVMLAQDDFGEAFAIGAADGLAICSPGETLHPHGGISLSGLRFRQPHKSNLREGIDGVGNHIVVHAGTMAHRVFSRYFPLGRGDVCEACPMYQVADAIDTWQVRLHALVD